LRHFLYDAPRSSIANYKIYANIYGLADALCHIHDFKLKSFEFEMSKIGYHHDLRPANILVCGEKFVLTDFGLSNLKPDDQNSQTNLRGGDEDYLGPENFDYRQSINGSVGRPLDVWAFGCILAEIATYIEHESVVEFHNKRRATHEGEYSGTNSAFHLEGKIRPAVSEWLDSLKYKLADPQLAELINLIHGLLNPDPKGRPKMQNVAPELQILAIESMFSQINIWFQEYICNTNGADMSSRQVYLLLEDKRVSAFREAFAKLHSDTKIKCAAEVFKSLQSLLDFARDFEAGLDSQNNAAADMDGELPTAVLAKIDSLCNAIPWENAETFETLWSEAVCHIKHTDILKAIRLSSKLRRYRLVGIHAAMTYMSRVVCTSIQLSTESRILESAVIETWNRPLFPNDVKIITDASKTMGSYEGKRVLIEWKEYDIGWKDKAEELFSTMNNLVNLLDPEKTPREGVTKERILNCLGYYHQRNLSRFGFVYSLGGTSEQSELFSLNCVLRLSPENPPDLGDLFVLAKDLAVCLLKLHLVGWLHKNLSSHQVLVFAPDATSTRDHVASAVLSGFNDSRPEASSITLGPKQDLKYYKHPKYRTGTSFTRYFDYYGLGIVLLEIGSWSPISELRGYHPEIKSDEEFRQKLLESYVPQLGVRMGRWYRDAVKACLDAEHLLRSMHQNPEDGKIAHEFFKKNVVEPLAECRA
jgi:hypothetical protein